MEKEIISTRKITLFPQGDKDEIDRVYKYLRDGMEVQSYMMNMCMSAMYSARLRKASKEEKKEIELLYSRVPTSKKGSAYSFDMAKYPTGLPIAGHVPYACKQKLGKSIKDGLMYGKVSLPSFKNTMPLMVSHRYLTPPGTKTGSGKNFGLFHEYDSPGALSEALLKDNSPKIHIRFANNIMFNVVFGNPYKSAEIRSVIEKIFAGEYKVCDSSIGFDKKTGKKIILYLAVSIPVEQHRLDEDTCVGVDIGLAIPAVCALNNNSYKRLSLGTYDNFTRKRTQLQNQRKRIQRALKCDKGGHGREKKLAHLKKLKIHEREWAQTYNHTISRRVVDFAERNHAKYINIENLSGIKKEKKNSFVLRNWSYHELQSMIIAKASMKGIEVRKINPAYTSQTCSVCGKLGIRSSQSEFTCSDPACKSHAMYEKTGFNADFNAARNIAMSTNFVEEEMTEEESV